MMRFALRLIGFHVAWWAAVTILTVMATGCVTSPISPSGPGRRKVIKSIVGCEYYFDKHGVRSYYWMSGPPHEDLTIRACYSDDGAKVER